MVWAFVERFPAPPVALRGPEHQGQTSSTVSSSKVHWSTPFQREKWLEYVWSIIKTHFSSKSVIIATPPNKTIQIGDQRKPVEVWTFSTISSSVCPGPHSDAHPGSFYPLPQGSWGSPKSTDSMVMPRGPTWKPLEWIPCRDTSWRPAMRTTGDNRGQPGSFNALATFLFHSLYPMIVRFNYVPGTWTSIRNQQALSDMKQWNWFAVCQPL